MLKIVALPKLYKYLKFDSAKLVLEKCSLRWSHPSLFNDPFDNQLDIVMHDDDELHAEQVKKHYLEMLTQKNSTPQDQRLQAMIDLMRAIPDVQKILSSPDDLLPKNHSKKK